ncbi:MAG: hypothetical protein HN521_17705 [Candidatus Latescibacteria bacterium]|jgi:hypothetical protein|nr:hypothetical protein [Candidatus Latescibacterota bacterium]
MRPNEYIEEAIEESYLIGLNEEEIRTNLNQFIDTCGQVIREHMHDKQQMQMLAEKLARARALSLIEDRQDGEWDEIQPVSDQPNLAERVARNKRLILRAISESDPRLIEKIEKARFPKDQQKTPDANQQAWTGTTTTNKTSHLLVKIGSLAAILIILLIIYLSLLQHV